MVKRSSSKRAYKKRRTVRKSRVIHRKTQQRRCKTQQRKTQRGGGFTIGDAKGFLGNTMTTFKNKAQNFADTTGATMVERARNFKVPGFDAFNSFRNMSFQDKILSQLGAAFTVVLSVSKMISYIGTYIYIAKLMISNPDYAKQMFELKKQEIKAKNQELAACFETALKSADSGAAPTPAPAQEAPKDESLADILISRLTEFRQSQSKSQFLKDIAKNLIERKRAEIESLKFNQTTKVIYECLKKALNMVDEK